MARSGGDPIREELDDFIRAFELAYARDGDAEIVEFLPPSDSPLHATVLRELVRVDLEYRWERGRPRPLSEYQDAYPGLLLDPDGLREIARDESRLRREVRGGLGGASSIARMGPRRASSLPGRLAPGREIAALEGGAPNDGPPDGLEAVSFAYREFCRHQGRVDPASLERWCESFPGHAGHARLLRDIHLSDPGEADRLARGLISLPRVGDEFAGFRLIGELGRGAFGRVYLARQGDLADRPVALKVSPRLFDEAKSLARLQHTNIVPIYSVHRVGPLQAVCMPFFGTLTLKDVFAILKIQGAPPTSGQGLVSALHERKLVARSRGTSVESGGTAPSSPAPEESRSDSATPATLGPATETMQRLERLTYVQAILWIASRLADGLAHAHERGILHHDLKPANILLTDDGQPMLLDFNLSADLKDAPQAVAAVGGTLPYMAPEHLDAYRGAARPVDARSDIYSFGIILHELLTGRPFSAHPVPSEGLIDRLIEERLRPPPDLRSWNKAVSPAVVSIVRQCLESDPSRRYQAARDLREDLERQLADRPLRHAPEPPSRERLAKWARRHPTMFSSGSIALFCLMLVAALGVASWLLSRDLSIASARLHRDRFRTTFAKCQLLLNTAGGPSNQLDRGVRLARQALGEYGVGGAGYWDDSPLIRDLPATEQGALREELSELVQLEARARVALAKSSGSGPDLRRALLDGVARLDQAERFDPRPSAALYEDRGRFHAALGRQALANRDLGLASRTTPTLPRDLYLLGASLLARGQPDKAEAPLSRAATLDPRRLWAWFVLGICHSDQGRHLDAAFDFSVCSFLEPEFAWTHLNRGLALARAGRLIEARQAYDRALQKDPDFVEALVDRALACLELDDAGQAVRDLDRAVALGRRTPAVLTALAEALSRSDRREEANRALDLAIRADPSDPMPVVARGFARMMRHEDGAREDFALALERDPRNARARLGLAHLLRRDDIHAALSQTNSALEADPNLGDALQLRALIHARLGNPAAEIDVDRLLQAPTPQRLFNAACALSLLSRSQGNDPRLVDRALNLLGRAIDAGLPPSRLAHDPDLDALQDSPRFARLLNRGR